MKIAHFNCYLLKYISTLKIKIQIIQNIYKLKKGKKK